MRPNPPMVWLSSATKVSAGCAATASRSFLSSRSMPFLPKGGWKARGSRKMSMSSENRWIRFQPFARLVPPLKMILSPSRDGDDPQCFRDVVVLLDDGRAQSPLRENVPLPGGSPARNRDVRTASCQRRSLACQLRACRSPASSPKSNRENGFREPRRRRSAARFFPSCSPMAPSIARTRGGSEVGDLEQTLKAPFLREKRQGSADGFFRRQFACPARPAQEIEQRRIGLGETGPCFRPARVDDGVAADEVCGAG